MTDLFEFFTVDYQPRVLSGWLLGKSAKYVESLSDKEVLTNLVNFRQAQTQQSIDSEKELR